MGWTGNSTANWEMGWEMGYFKTIPGNGWEMGRVKMGEHWCAAEQASRLGPVLLLCGKGGGRLAQAAG